MKRSFFIFIALFATAFSDPLSVKSQIYEVKKPVYNSCSQLEVNKGLQLYVQGNFLYWTTREEGLYYAADTQVIAPPAQDVQLNSIIGSLKKTDFDWDAGLKIGVGYNTPFDCWNLFANWTYFSSSANDTHNAPTTVLWGHTSRQNAQFASYADAHWKMKIHIIDLELGRSSWMGKSLSIRPFIGVEGTIIDQVFNIFYIIMPGPDVATPITNTIRPKSDFNGIGLKSGANLNFYLGKAWSIYADLAASLIYGKFDCRLKTWNTFINTQQKVMIVNSKDTFHQSVPSLQLALGLDWADYLWSQNCLFGLQLGWEQQLWFGVNKMQHYIHKLDEGKLFQGNENLTLQGFVLTAHLHF